MGEINFELSLKTILKLLLKCLLKPADLCVWCRQGSPEQQAAYLSWFRADSIVKDSEVVRKELVSSTQNGGKWSLLGQSFGGFCAVHYLSVAPEGLCYLFVASCFDG